MKKLIYLIIIAFITITSTYASSIASFEDCFADSSRMALNSRLQLNDITTYPNPAVGQIKLQYNLHQQAEVSVSVINILGNELLNIPSSVHEAGVNVDIIDFQGKLSKGIYYIRIRSRGEVQMKRIFVE